MQPKFLIIAGSEKCGTTSLFQYIADTKLVNISKAKETDYFRNNSSTAVSDYLNEFLNDNVSNVFLEASPGYLSDSHISANRITNTLDNYHLVFCIRNPLDRLTSSFLFHKSRFYIPKDMSFDQYFDECMKYEKGQATNNALSEWCLRVPDCGKYAKHLADFNHVPTDKITIVTFEQLTQNPCAVVTEICEKLNLATTFFDGYAFGQSNSTRGHKNDRLQKTALKINKALETFWFKYPAAKQALLKVYSKINGAPKEKLVISAETLLKVRTYYEADLNSLLQHNVCAEHVKSWLNKMKIKHDS